MVSILQRGGQENLLMDVILTNVVKYDNLKSVIVRMAKVISMFIQEKKLVVVKANLQHSVNLL
jgi:hypothetical protein